MGQTPMHQRVLALDVHQTKITPPADLLWRGRLRMGLGALESAGPGEYHSNFAADLRDFAHAAGYDYRLKPASRLAGRATDPGSANGQSLRVQREYAHPSGTRALGGPTHNPGALQHLAPSSH